MHSPHHPTKEWVDKIRQMKLFDEGWNKMRERIFANQKKLGVIPQNAKLTAWPKDLPEWNSLSAEEKKLYIRQAEVYAAYLAYTDHEIGRVIQAIANAGKLDQRRATFRPPLPGRSVRPVPGAAKKKRGMVPRDTMPRARAQGKRPPRLVRFSPQP